MEYERKIERCRRLIVTANIHLMEIQRENKKRKKEKRKGGKKEINISEVFTAEKPTKY